MLRRYWFKFVPSEKLSCLHLGCGVTAYDEQDARRMLVEQVFPLFETHEVAEVIADIDVSSLEENHVLPNIGIPCNRGVWFPAL